MLKKRTIKEEDAGTGKILTTTTRYDGTLRKVLQGDTVILVKLGDEEVLNMPIKIPKGKELHTRVTITSILADSVKKKEVNE